MIILKFPSEHQIKIASGHGSVAVFNPAEVIPVPCIEYIIHPQAECCSAVKTVSGIGPQKHVPVCGILIGSNFGLTADDPRSWACPEGAIICHYMNMSTERRYK